MLDLASINSNNDATSVENMVICPMTVNAVVLIVLMALTVRTTTVTEVK